MACIRTGAIVLDESALVEHRPLDDGTNFERAALRVFKATPPPS